MKSTNTQIACICLLWGIAIGCKEADDVLKVTPHDPVVSLSVADGPGEGGIIEVSVIEDETEINLNYSAETSSTIQNLVLTIGGSEEPIAEAIGQESFSGIHVLQVPYVSKTIQVRIDVTDENELTASETIAIQVVTAGDFIVEGDVRISGSVRQGEELTIKGSGFGQGPNVIIYDDFEGVHEGLIPLTSPLIGQWTSVSTTYKARYHEYGYSGTTSFSMQDDLATTDSYGKKDAQLKVRFDDTQEVFMSFQVAVPPGKHFPGAPTRDEWGAASHWKMTWLMDTDDGFGSNDGKADLCIPTNGQAKALQIVGNTDNVGWVGSLDDLFDIDGFNRVAVWVRAHPDEPAASGYTWIQWLSSKTNPIFTREHIKPVFNALATSPTSYQWNQWNVPGWFGNSLVNPGGVYDDVYLSTGANAPARVEIGDAPDYEDCTELSIMPPTSWSDTEIKVIVKTKGTETISQKYLFIFNGSNQLIEGGIQIP